MPRRTARGGLPVQGALPPRRPVAPPTRRKGPFIALAFAVVALTLSLAGRRIIATGYFEVQKIEVAGTTMVSEDAVRAATGVIGKQFWKVDTTAVAAAVQQVPGVRAARAERAWPNRLSLTVDERVPAAIWRSGAAELVVDEDGYVLERPVMGGLPAISDLDGSAVPNAGERVDGDAVRLAMQLVSALPVAVGQRVGRFEYRSGTGLDVVTSGGLRVHFGDGQNITYKLELWRGILEQAKREKLTPSEIDLRYGKWASVR